MYALGWDRVRTQLIVGCICFKLVPGCGSRELKNVSGPANHETVWKTYFHALSVPKNAPVQTGPDSTDRWNAYVLQHFLHAGTKHIIASVPESVPEYTPKYIKKTQ